MIEGGGEAIGYQTTKMGGGGGGGERPGMARVCGQNREKIRKSEQSN